MLTIQGNRLSATPRTPLAYTRTPVSYMTPDEDSSNIPRSYSDHVAVMRPERSTARMLSRTGNTAPIYAGSNVSRFTEPAPFTGDAGTCEAIAAYRPEGWPEGLENSRDEWVQLLGNPATLTARTAQQLAGAFQNPTARDCLMTDVVTSAPDQFAAVMLGVFPVRPDWARVDTAQEVAFELMKATPEGQRAPMLCLIGWLEWLKGKSSFAARYFKLALADATDYRLAVLLAEVVNRGLVADCARNPEQSYARPKNRR